MSTRSFRPIPFRALAGAAAFVALAALPGAARAQSASAIINSDPGLRIELDYITALNKAGFPEYAEMAIRDVEAKFPQARVLVKIKKLEQLLLLARFDEAKAIIAAEKDQESAETWGMKLTMGDYLYAHGKYPEALGIFKGLLDKYGTKPDPKLGDMYANSVFKYAQMLMFLGKDREAIPVYEKLAAIEGLTSDQKRWFTFELAQLMVKVAESGTGAVDTGLLDSAQKQIDKLMWIQDIWFGRSVALMAHIRMAKGNIDGAKSRVDDYMDQLVDMDQQLREFSEQEGQDFMNMSPLAECRYLLGTMFMDEAKKRLQTAKPRSKEEDAAADLLLDAMEHFVNVYVQYPSFSWAGEAMSRSEDCAKILDELGFEVQDSITPKQRHDVAVKQFQNAGVLYKQNQFKEAMKTYQTVLASFPDEIPSSLIGLENIAMAAIELSETDEANAEYLELYSGAVLGHIAEHFARFPKQGMLRAGNTLRNLSQFYAGHNKGELAREAMSLYFRLYPNHPQAASSVMGEAMKRYRATPPDLDGAIEYLSIMVDKYAKHPNSYAAERYLADCYKQKGETDLEYATRTNYLARVMKKEKPGNELIGARYSIANMLRDRAVSELREATLAMAEAAKPVAGESEEDAAARSEKARKDLLAAGKKIQSLVNKQIKPLIDILSDPKERSKYEASADERRFNDTVLEHCYFDRAFCLASLHEPKAQEAEFKKQAIESYEKILAIYEKAGDDEEKAKQAEGVLPRVLLQLGTLYTTLKTEDAAEQEANTKKASDYFSRLSKEFGSSEEARNALFLQGKSLIDLGYTTQGIAKFKEMFASPGGKYTATQLNTAAQELLNARAYNEADQGFKAALAAAPEGDAGRVLRAQIAIGQIQILVPQGVEGRRRGAREVRRGEPALLAVRLRHRAARGDVRQRRRHRARRQGPLRPLPAGHQGRPVAAPVQAGRDRAARPEAAPGRHHGHPGPGRGRLQGRGGRRQVPLQGVRPLPDALHVPPPRHRRPRLPRAAGGADVSRPARPRPPQEVLRRLVRLRGRRQRVQRVPQGVPQGQARAGGPHAPQRGQRRDPHRRGLGRVVLRHARHHRAARQRGHRGRLRSHRRGGRRPARARGGGSARRWRSRRGRRGGGGGGRSRREARQGGGRRCRR